MTTIDNLADRLRTDPESCVGFLTAYDKYARSRWVTMMLVDSVVTGVPADIVPVPPPAPGWDDDCDRIACARMNMSIAALDYLSGRRGADQPVKWKVQ